jgi:aryl-alcohol dehydrogenase-like predicted oxidoreductase
MKKRNLGKSGLKVTLAGIGCNNFGWFIDDDRSRKTVFKALDLGINLFDTADVYGRGGSETLLGQLLADRRKDVILATKFALPMDDAEILSGASRHYIFSAVEASLQRLKTDWIDLYQVHRWDPSTPMEETVRALEDLVQQGKVRYIGLSNHPAWKVVEAQWITKTLGADPFISCQDEYSLLHRAPEHELIPAAEAYGLGLLPYFPLASGLLSGKYKRESALPAGTRMANRKGIADRYLTEQNWAIVDKVDAFCTQRGHTLLELAFSWLAAKPVVSSIIAGATTPEQLEQNVKALEWQLTPEDLAEVDRLTKKN